MKAEELEGSAEGFAAESMLSVVFSEGSLVGVGGSVKGTANKGSSSSLLVARV